MPTSIRNSVLITGIDTPIGLAIIRELGRHGVRVYGLTGSARSIGARSRFLKRAFQRPEHLDALPEHVAGICRREDIEAVIAISEADIAIFNTQRDALSDLVLLFPDAERFGRVVDKAETYRLARELGIEVPSEWTIDREGAPVEPLTQNDFPVVLKWADPAAVRAGLERHGLPLIKAEYANDTAELEAALAKYRPLGQYPLVQSYCPGRGLGQFFYCRRGEAIRRFQHERIHEWPPEGGFSTACRAVPLTRHPELLARSEALLRALEWDGVAMVEYRHDPETGRHWLMEINGRFWGSYPLAAACGAEFAWYLLHDGEPPDGASLRPPRDDLFARYMIPEVKRLARVLFAPDAIHDRYFVRQPLSDAADFFLRFGNPNGRYFIFSARDPAPFIADTLQILTRPLRR